jgi:hypothetical protein
MKYKAGQYSLVDPHVLDGPAPASVRATAPDTRRRARSILFSSAIALQSDT